VYDYLNEEFLGWKPADAAHYRQWARPCKGCEELTDYDGLEPLGWRPI
jgi:hypothetical protein